MRQSLSDPFTNPDTVYQILDHTADLRIRVSGSCIPELFANTGFSLIDLIVDPQSLSADGTTSLSLSGTDWPDLLIAFLREILYLWSGEEKLVCGIRMREIVEYHLTAEIDFAYYDPDRHRIRQEIKAVTYHQARVGRCGRTFFSEFILDV